MPNNITPELALALVKAINEVGTGVTADATNPFHKNTYATLGAHLEATKGTFAKHGLAIVQFPISVPSGVGIETTIIHKDGGYISQSVTIPVGETLKGQDAGSLFSYLRRYALASVAGLATTDDDAESDRIVRTPSSTVASSSGKTHGFDPSNGGSIPSATAKFIDAATGKLILAANSSTKAEPARAIMSAGSNSKLSQALGYIVPFGKNKGVTLGELPENSLSWYIKEYQPKPYNGKISEKDEAFRNALDTIRDSRSSPEETSDEVPF